jgi:hypothetical protein
VEAVHLGPGSILAAAEVQLASCFTADDVAATLLRVRATLKADIPSITRLYLTPVAAVAAPEPAGASPTTSA